MRGTPASSQIIWLEDRVKEQADEIERLRNKVQWLEMVENTVVKQHAEIERLQEAFVREREDNLWNAYNMGVEKGEEWTHCFMSDGEWLVRELGLNPLEGYYSINEIKAGIPIAARAALKGDE